MTRAHLAHILAGMLAALAIGCADEPPGGVLLIGIDTLRADHLGCYGYDRPTSPRIDAFARDGVLFEQAVSQSSWTLPAFASILTGVLPSRHGAGEGKSCLRAPCAVLGEEYATLAQVFRDAGYRTASFVSNGFAGSAVGLGRGFEQAEDSRLGPLAVKSAVGWLTEHRREPFFLFVHLVEPHAPYAPPDADRALFVDPSYAGPIVAETTGLADPNWTDADRRHIVDLYDGDVHWTDRMVGDLLDALGRLGLDARTLVVVTADHGEELFERGELGHGHTMYDELLHVPLIVRFPGGTPRGRIARQVRTMDVFPTVLEAMGRPVPAGLDGKSVLAVARGGTDPAFDVALAEFTYRAPERKVVRRPPDKMILDVSTNRPLLFDLAADPGERADLAAQARGRVMALRRDLVRPNPRDPVGFYLLVRGDTRERRRVHIEASAPAQRFGESGMREGEADDSVTLSPDGTRATADLTLERGDVDVVWLRTMPIVHTLQLESVTVDGEPLATGQLMLGRRPARAAVRFPMTVAATGVMVDATERPSPGNDGGLRLAVQAVMIGPRKTMQLDPGMRERLRALGYGD